MLWAWELTALPMNECGRKEANHLLMGKNSVVFLSLGRSPGKKLICLSRHEKEEILGDIEGLHQGLGTRAWRRGKTGKCQWCMASEIWDWMVMPKIQAPMAVSEDTAFM